MANASKIEEEGRSRQEAEVQRTQHEPLIIGTGGYKAGGCI